MEKYKLGVVVGRFQLPAPHEGHTELIKHVFNHNDQVLVFIGCGQQYSFNDPLPYNYRKAAIGKVCSNDPKPSYIYPIHDTKYDDVWNKNLDAAINKHISEYMKKHQKTVGIDVCLYGSRDSFLKTYDGEFRTEFVKDASNHGISATTIRKGYHKYVNENSCDWAKGVIHVTGNLFPTSYQCVDIGCFDAEFDKILLGKRKDQPGWRLPGGFVDPTDDSLESAAIRELEEETSITSLMAEPSYIKSFRINDYRYKKEPHKIMTALFICFTTQTVISPTDDLDEVKWFDVDTLDMDMIEGVHKKLVEVLIKHIKEY